MSYFWDPKTPAVQMSVRPRETCRVLTERGLHGVLEREDNGSNRALGKAVLHSGLAPCARVDDLFEADRRQALPATYSYDATEQACRIHLRPNGPLNVPFLQSFREALESCRRPPQAREKFLILELDESCARADLYLHDAGSRLRFFEILDEILSDDRLPWIKVPVVMGGRVLGSWCDLVAACHFVSCSPTAMYWIDSVGPSDNPVHRHPVYVARAETPENDPLRNAPASGSVTALPQFYEAGHPINLQAMWSSYGMDEHSRHALLTTMLATSGAGKYLAMVIQALRQNPLGNPNPDPNAPRADSNEMPPGAPGPINDNGGGR